MYLLQKGVNQRRIDHRFMELKVAIKSVLFYLLLEGGNITVIPLMAGCGPQKWKKHPSLDFSIDYEPKRVIS